MITKVVLSFSEFYSAVDAAKLRMAASAVKNLNHASTYKRNYIERLQEEVIGCCGEMAVAKALDKWFVPSIDTFHTRPDCFDSIEVRSTPRADGRLIVRDNDANDRVFILAIVNAPDITLAGWMLGGECKYDKYLYNPNDYRPAWFVPQKDLKTMDSLNVTIS